MKKNPLLTPRHVRLSLLAIACCLSVGLHAVDIDTTGGVSITAPFKIGENDTTSNITGAGTLTLSGSGTIGLADNGPGHTVNMNMSGGLIDIQSGVRLQNGGWSSGVWTSNLASINVASGGTLDVWDGNAVRIDALTGAGIVTITPAFGTNWALDRGLVLGVNNSNGTFTGTIDGNSGVDGGKLFLTKEGSGTQILTGANTYNGSTTISGGTLQIGNGGTTGALLNSNIINNAALAFNRSDASSYSGNINGSGTLAKAGAGVLTLTGNLDYGGATTITAGTLRLVEKVPNSSGSFAISSGAALEFNIGTSFDAGDGANATFGKVGGTTVTGSGTFIKSGAGVLALDGQGGNHAVTWNMTGGSIDIQGGTVRNGGWDGGIWTNNKASLNIASGARFDIWGGNSVIVDALTGAGLVDSSNYGGSQSLTVGINNGSGTFSGTFQNTSGNLSLVKLGTGTQTLSGANTYTGGTTISAGTLQIGDGGTTGALPTSNNISNNAALVFNRSDASSYAGNISGSGSVTKEGAGAHTLTGTLSYTGGTTVNGGRLVIENSTTGSPNFVTNADLEFKINSGTQQLQNGTLSGTGSLIKSGSSVLQLGGNGQPQTIALTGANSLIDVQGGVLRNEYGNSAWGGNKAGLNVATGAVFDLWDGNTTVDELTGSGMINKGWNNSNSLTIGINNGSGTFTGVIENNRTDLGYGGNGGGSLTLIKEGTGTQTLSGTNTYAGATTINAGAIRISANNALGSAASGTSISNGAALILDNVNYTTAEPVTINGTGISGGGALVNIGTSTLAGTITAASNATLNAGGGTLTTTGGLVKDGTTLIIAGGGKVIVNGTGISGASASSDLIVDGTTLVVNAASNYNGPTTVQNSGTLVANAAVTSTQVTISANSTLSGTGSITTAGSANYIYLNGTLQVGDSTLGSPTASFLDLKSSGASGSTILATASSSSLYFDLFQRGGDLTATAASADYIRLFGSLDASLGGTLFITDSIAGAHTFADGDMWRIFDLTSGGTISDGFSLNYSSLSLSGGLTGSFDRTSGTFSILGVPESSRALLLFLGFAGLVTRRRRLKL